MTDLKLRRRIAELKGIYTLERHGADAFPAWECDLAAAGELWAELENLEWDDTVSASIDRCDSTRIEAYVQNTFGENICLVEVYSIDIPDPAERLARAIALLWVAWAEKRGDSR